ncbi:DUF4214 domain-containing protein [Pseudomonas guariconensis]|uniref:DUF4214 domain-containing protein n=1 Tax=Pseudomonas guariconensis TaxID=1288410 RepID=UPI002D1EE8C5|nr:DUF4214 domain-containing protein [Pseudomonas guariconensis]MEB3881595.1 DUF4214 domain-containing protein [Pseudomonas guariconensis]MEB3898029.1 DUF4214 domain-containing protein [Pseudomonas guariconensis]
MSTQSDLAELYTTFFDRAPDAGGLAYWVAQVEGGQITLAQVAENWLNEQPEGVSKFPSGQTDAQFIEAMYNNLLGRAPDTGGGQYWLDQLQSGAVSRDSFALTLINGAKANTSTQGQQDAALVNNKATVGVAFAAKGLNDLTLASSVVKSVTADANTLSATQAIIGLIPSASADQSAAILSAANQLLTQLSTLITSAPGEVADAAIYLNALLSGATSSTNLTTLLTNANTLLTNAATDPTALDNPASKGADTVAGATPGSGGGETPATFTATLDGGVLTFGGSASGNITVTTDGTDIVFARGGVSAASLKVAEITSISGTAAFSLAVGDFELLESALAQTQTVTISDTSAKINANLVTLLSSAKVDSITSSENDVAINLTVAQATAANLNKLSEANTIAVTGTSTEVNASLAALLSSTKVDSITSSENNVAINLTVAQATALNLDKLSVDNTIVVTGSSNAINASLADLLSSTKVDTINSTDDSTPIVLNVSQVTSANLGKLVLGDTISLTDSTASLESALATLTGLQSTELEKIDSIDSTGDTLKLSAEQAAVLGSKLTAADVITITNTLTQGDQSIAGGFQSGNDKLQFTATELTGATGFAAYGGGSGPTITFTGGAAELVVSTGGTLVASGAHAAFLFDTATGELTFDADGTGTEAAIPVVTLTGVNTLAAADLAFV